MRLLSKLTSLLGIWIVIAGLAVVGEGRRRGEMWTGREGMAVVGGGNGGSFGGGVGGGGGTFYIVVRLERR